MANFQMKTKKILLVDDEKDLLDMVEAILKENGYTDIKTASSCSEALAAAESFKPELAVLDVMLPDGSGLDLFRELRKKADYPILFLTARGEDDDRLRGFGIGADDYIVKPFLPRELVFRIAAILHRTYKDESGIVSLEGSQIDFEKAQVIKNGEVSDLTAKEFEILSALYRAMGRIVTIDSLCDAAWGDNAFGYENSLMAHIRRIREKIEVNPSKPVSLITVKGLGYKLLTKESKR